MRFNVEDGMKKLEAKNKRLQQELEIASLNHKAERRTRRRLQQELDTWKKAYEKIYKELQELKGNLEDVELERRFYDR